MLIASFIFPSNNINTVDCCLSLTSKHDPVITVEAILDRLRPEKALIVINNLDLKQEYGDEWTVEPSGTMVWMLNPQYH